MSLFPGFSEPIANSFDDGKAYETQNVTEKVFFALGCDNNQNPKNILSKGLEETDQGRVVASFAINLEEGYKGEAIILSVLNKDKQVIKSVRVNKDAEQDTEKIDPKTHEALILCTEEYLKGLEDNYQKQKLENAV